MAQISRTVGCSLLAATFVGGLLLGTVMAAKPVGKSHPAKGRAANSWNPYKFGNNELLIVFAVDKDGDVEASYRDFGSNPGKPAAWQNITNPLAEINLDIKVGNPKVCWTTSSGDKQCVVY